jgi:CheY-like chemotaxis protein
LALESAREPGVVQALGRVNENAETLMGLISDLLDVSKIEAGQFEWERVAFPLRARLRQAVAPAAERAIRKGVAFSVSIDEGLPETVLGDATRLRQIVANLAENAVKFTDCGYVSVEALGAGTGLELRVSDSGAGVPEAVLPFLFDRFFQGDSSTTRRKGGAGLGLSIVKSLVNAMGGSVSVRNVPGAGAEFRVWVPIEAVAVVAEAPLPVAAPVAVGDILVAEDNDDNFAIVERHLTNQGYRLERAVNGLAAVSAAARKQFDLILMDVEMPEMDGLEATRLIRAGGSSVPIVALTAHAVMGYRERCLAVGCTGYLAKPVRKRELLEGVAAALLRA